MATFVKTDKMLIPASNLRFILNLPDGKFAIAHGFVEVLEVTSYEIVELPAKGRTGRPSTPDGI
jgi:hypothetical protein